MKKIYTLVLFIAVASSISSCKKFLEEKPKGLIIATNVNDFELIFNSSQIVQPWESTSLLDIPTDDVFIGSISLTNLTNAVNNTYMWRPYINNDRGVSPVMWGTFYNSITNLNVITEGVLKAPDGLERRKKELYAEAVVSRVFLYNTLLSFFAPPYDKATAGTNYGLPYITTTDVSKPAPARPSLQKSYDIMIEEITKVMNDLPESEENISRPVKLTAYALLARIYLSMQDFANAEKYTDMVLDSGKPTLLDYNSYTKEDFPKSNVSAEELFLRYQINDRMYYSSELIRMFDTTADKRILLFGTPSYFSSLDINSGIGYAEVYLTKAECLARNGKIAEALNIVNNTIRSKRLTPKGYKALQATTKEKAIQIVLNERRRELRFKGVRWTDMRRLDQENRMATVKRYSNDKKQVIDSLPPHSLKYTYQIPLTVQAFNPNMPLNKR